jgi:protein-disulfide isomerase
MLKKLLLGPIVFASFWLAAGGVSAQTPTCDKLPKDKKALAKALLDSQHPYDCCDDTISACLKKKPVCNLAYRLAENICRRVADNQDKQKIMRGLSRRARSMMPQKKVTIGLAGLPVAGDPKSPITAVEYACARCPYCSKLTPKLYEAVTEGRLKGKVKLYFKPFPIRSHEYSKESGLAYVAAAKLGEFWAFMLYSYEHFDSFCVMKQTDWAEAVGMDRAAFEAAMADPVTRSLLVESKKEGIVNGVDATPTIFIDGRKFVGDMSYEEVVDVLEEAYDKAQGKTYR